MQIPDSYLLFLTLNRPDRRLARFGLLSPRARQGQAASVNERFRVYQIVNFGFVMD